LQGLPWAAPCFCGPLRVAGEEHVEAPLEHEHGLGRVALGRRPPLGERLDQRVQLLGSPRRGGDPDLDQGQLLFDQPGSLPGEAALQRTLAILPEEPLQAVGQRLHARPPPPDGVAREPGLQPLASGHGPDRDPLEAVPGQRFAREPLGDLATGCVEVVHLVQHDVHADGVTAELVQQRQLRLPDRRVDGHDHQRRVRFRQGRQSRLGVVRVGRPQSGHVDHDQVGCKPLGQLDLDARDAQPVAGVSRLVDVVAQLPELDLALRPVEETDVSGLPGSERDARRHGRHREDARR